MLFLPLAHAPCLSHLADSGFRLRGSQGYAGARSIQGYSDNPGREPGHGAAGQASRPSVVQQLTFLQLGVSGERQENVNALELESCGAPAGSLRVLFVFRPGGGHPLFSTCHPLVVLMTVFPIASILLESRASCGVSAQSCCSSDLRPPPPRVMASVRYTRRVSSASGT